MASRTDMAIATSKQISRYFDQYKQVDVTFNRQVIHALGLLSREVYLKCQGEVIPCLIYSCSMSGARVISTLRAGTFEKFRQAHNAVALRFSFQLPDKLDPIHFFAQATITGFHAYQQDRPDLYFLSLAFTKRPPDDLIVLLGELLDANANAQRRKEERIVITPESWKTLGLSGRDAEIVFGRSIRKCILRDLSFSGAKVLVVGSSADLSGRAAVLKLSAEGGKEEYGLLGAVVRTEEVEGRAGITALGIRFVEPRVPLSYKMRLNDYLKSMRPSRA